jgi:hypothetical protein
MKSSTQAEHNKYVEWKKKKCKRRDKADQKRHPSRRLHKDDG